MTDTIPIFDLHCHPCLKAYLFNKRIDVSHHPLPDLLPTGMHVDLPGMERSGVRVACSFHYIPESGLGNLPGTRRIFKVLKALRPRFIEKFEPVDSPDGAFDRTLYSIELFNEAIESADKSFNAVVASNVSDFTSQLNLGRTIFLHCIEGAHHLGREENETQLFQNLVQLKEKGICIITIGHFFPNVVCDSAGGIPPSTACLIGYVRPPVPLPGLSSIGSKLIHWCQEHGLVIDLVHATIETRRAVYNILAEREKNGLRTRPLIFSHSGIREIAAKKMKNEKDRLILPDIEEMRIIKKYNGVLGLILMNYWIIGEEEDNIFKKQKGISHIIETIRFLYEELGDFENISIGTDLDGFTQVPDDLCHVRHLGRLRENIISEFGHEAAEKICFKNALRVIQEGWS